jgi:hypothetical protein
VSTEGNHTFLVGSTMADRRWYYVVFNTETLKLDPAAVYSDVAGNVHAAKADEFIAAYATSYGHPVAEVRDLIIPDILRRLLIVTGRRP